MRRVKPVKFEEKLVICDRFFMNHFFKVSFTLDFGIDESTE